jgi:hypothetical protein
MEKAEGRWEWERREESAIGKHCSYCRLNLGILTRMSFCDFLKFFPKYKEMRVSTSPIVSL